MPVPVDITVDPIDRRQLERELAGIANGVPRVIAVATRRSVDSIRSRVVKIIASDLPVAQNKLYAKGNDRRPVTTRLVRENGDVAGGRIDVGGSGGRVGSDEVPAASRIPVGRFKPTPIGKGLRPDGVKFKLRKSGGATRIAADATGPFILQFKSGYTGVFRRDASRGRLVQLHGPSVPHVAQQQPQMKQLTQTEAAAIYQKNIASQVDRLLQRSRRNG